MIFKFLVQSWFKRHFHTAIFASIAAALLWRTAMALPWLCHSSAMAVPLQCRGSAMAVPSVPWQCHGSAMAVPQQCLAVP